MSTEESSEAVSDFTPGMQLRNAREQAGVSLQTISERTLISITKLQALERDDFATVGGTAHVTGFTKAYARALGLDAAALIKDVERAMGVEKSRIDAANLLATAKTTSQLMWLYPALIAVLLVLVALWMALWWFNGDSSEDSPLSRPTVQQNAAPPAEVMSRLDDSPTSQDVASEEDEEPPGVDAFEGDTRTSGPILEEGAAVPLTRESRLPRKAEEQPETVNSAVVPRTAPVISQTQNSPVASESTAPLEQTPAATDALEAGPATEPYAQAPGEVTAGDTEAPNLAPDELQFIFIEDCWLQVGDATGNIIVEELAKAGQTRTITGTAPFRVVLGDATAVALILLNDESVPFSSRPGRPVLRMTIGE